MARVAVIGAGVVGLACASELRRRGWDVTLVDARPPGEYCSFGNAGCFSRSSFVPLALPGTWKKVPGWLLDPNSPLSIPLRNAGNVARWLWRLNKASSISKVNRIADELAPLLRQTIEKWRPLADWAKVPDLIREQGWAIVYESAAAYEGDALGRELRSARGVEIQVLQGPAIREFAPGLSPRITHMVWLPEQGHCPSPLRLSRALAAALQASGATFCHGYATGFRFADGKVAEVVTTNGVVATDAVVVAAGAHSHVLSSQLGCSILLEAERGYHVMLEQPSEMPPFPVMSGEGKYFLTPMEEGLRVAGTVELAGLSAPPNFRRADVLEAGANRVLPGLGWSGSSRWMGFRPSLPDSKPVIGRSPSVANAFFAFGHGHVGLTAAAPTAEIIADIIAERRPFIDVSPFAPDRPEVRA